MATSSKTRSGKLNTPIFTDKLSSDESLMVIVPRMMVNLIEIADHYEVSMNSERFWQELAIKLLLKHEPSMRTKRRKDAGRKKEWTNEKYAKLYLQVELLRSQSRMKPPIKNITTICKSLAKQDYWRQTGIESGKALQTRYSTAKKTPLVMAIHLIEKGHPDGRYVARKNALEYFGLL